MYVCASCIVFRCVYKCMYKYSMLKNGGVACLIHLRCQAAALYGGFEAAEASQSRFYRIKRVYYYVETKIENFLVVFSLSIIFSINL